MGDGERTEEDPLTPHNTVTGRQMTTVVCAPASTGSATSQPHLSGAAPGASPPSHRCISGRTEQPFLYQHALLHSVIRYVSALGFPPLALISTPCYEVI